MKRLCKTLLLLILACGTVCSLLSCLAVKPTEITVVERIICKSEGYTPCDPGKAEDEQLIEEGFDGYIHEKFTDGLTVRIECDYEPKSADRLKPLEFICAENDAYYTVEEQEDGTSCLIRFKKSGTCNVTVKARDEGNAQLKIQVRALPSADKFF